MKSHTKIAEDLGITRQAVDSWFKGRTKPNKSNMVQLAVSLDMHIEEVLKLFNKNVIHNKTGDIKIE